MSDNYLKTLALEELEGEVWGIPIYHSHLVETGHRLRRQPIGEFTTEELRIMIGQKLGLKFLIPIALDRLEKTR